MRSCASPPLFFFTVTAPTEIYTLSLHDALPIFTGGARAAPASRVGLRSGGVRRAAWDGPLCGTPADRKSTRLNSSHMSISYAVFCLKKKKNAPRLPFTGPSHDLRHSPTLLDALV